MEKIPVSKVEEEKEEDEEPEENEETEKKSKRLSNKEIFRILCFEYKQNGINGLRIDIISNIVANLYYPFDDGPSKQSFKNQIENLLKEHSFNGEIKEDAFCELMDKVEKYVNDESIKQFATKIFKRFDKDKDSALNKTEFEHLMYSYRDQSLTKNEIEEIYNDIMKFSTNKGGIDFEAFYMYSYGKLK